MKNLLILSTLLLCANAYSFPTHFECDGDKTVVVADMTAQTFAINGKTYDCSGPLGDIIYVFQALDKPSGSPIEGITLYVFNEFVDGKADGLSHLELDKNNISLVCYGVDR